jgi:hypothetical protein
MSQQTRDERLGLTGLNPEQRRQRLQQLQQQVDEERLRAKTALDARRAARRSQAAPKS